MATIVLQAAGAALGSVFGPVGAVLGRAAGALAGSAIDRAVFGGSQTVTGARLGDARIPGADEGSAIARAYGTVRIGGTLIWATRFEEDVISQRQGGKGGGRRVETFRYFANLALGICEGPIAGVRRVWADGRELDLTTISMRLYTGTDDQMPDPLIEAKQGTGRVPAYRGLAYAVFERLPLDTYGNRIPVLQFEVLRPVGTLESAIRAVTIIPGATEHGYDPMTVSEVTGPGTSRLINRNVFHAGSDWEASINELQALCPNLERVALVSAWFGTDLRAGSCRIVPGVEVSARTDETRPWSVSGISRAAAHLVSRTGGAPAYGGTPSDAGLIAAIADLKARGLKVYLYPFVMMDIPTGNGLADPYGGAEQKAYPWRGRITCYPGPGRPGSADRTATARSQVNAFCGSAVAGDFIVSGGTVTTTAGDEGYRRMVLHHAMLATVAGGIDGFIIGSELSGLTSLRDGAGAFPFVEKLVALAGDVRAILGSATKLTYAADWSEYAAYRPADGSGDLIYNLDPLWASSAIDAVGIDNYLPLSDWRHGDLLAGNPDGFRHAEDAAAMQAQVTAGEGFDWYYASETDRQARTRTPITDGLAGRPWVYRAKDVASWWGNVHRNRIGGVELSSTTAWIPGSKPVWFTELGCPAIDKGAGQPNVFADPKSAESAAPYFSSGSRSDAMQRRFLDATLAHWTGPDAPAGCVDPDHIFLWTWDARPVPAFPEQVGLYADGLNWQTGHWLTGRLGAGSAADILAAILADHGFDSADTSLVAGDLTGFVQAEQASARALIEPLMAALGLDAVEEGPVLRLRSPMRLASPALPIAVLAEIDGEAAFEERRAHGSDLPAETLIDHFDTSRDYERTVTRSRRLPGGGQRVARLSLPAVLHEGAALTAADDALRDRLARGRSLRFALPPNAIGPQPGDVVTLADGPEGRFIITRIEDGATRAVEAEGFASAAGQAGGPVPPRGDAGARSPAGGFSPVVHLMDLPVIGGEATEAAARAAVFARPWQPVTLSASATGEGYQPRLRLDRPARTGQLVDAVSGGVSGRFDRAGAILIDLHGGGLQSITDSAVLNGENRLAIRADNGNWEIAAFAGAEEITPSRWRLTRLLRGLFGTEDAMAAGAGLGQPVVLLDEAVVLLGLGTAEIGQSLNWIAETVRGGPVGPIAFAGGLRAETPLSPVHARGQRLAGGDIALRFTRRARRDADHWLEGDIALDEPVEGYRIEILDGATVRRVLEVATPAAVYAGADEIADFGSPQASLSLRIRQKGQKVALGVPLVTTVAV